MKKIIITIDTNDADYLTDYVKLDDDKFEKFLPLIRAIENFQPYLCSDGECYYNWIVGHDTWGDDAKFPNELYSEFPNELIEEFENTFLNFDLPYGMHTIIRMEDPVTDEVYVNAEYSVLQARADQSPMIQEYRNEDTKFYYTKASTGRALHCEQFCNMTKDELQLVKEHENLWKRIMKKYEKQYE